MPDNPELNPSIDEPYIVALPTYAATAWYHKKLAHQPTELLPFLQKVERFATGEYPCAHQGQRSGPQAASGPRGETARVYGPARRLSAQANLRIEYGAFQKTCWIIRI